jgi:hypothetical protein
MRGWQRLHDRADGLSLRSPRRPDRLVHRVEELEAESVLLRRTLDKLARAQNDGADPVAALERGKRKKGELI